MRQPSWDSGTFTSLVLGEICKLTLWIPGEEMRPKRNGGHGSLRQLTKIISYTLGKTIVQTQLRIRSCLGAELKEANKTTWSKHY